MARTLAPVDALLVGFGWTGAIMAKELTDAGLDVLALERGAWADTSREFATTFAQDELRYYWRHCTTLLPKCLVCQSFIHGSGQRLHIKWVNT